MGPAAGARTVSLIAEKGLFIVSLRLSFVWFVGNNSGCVRLFDVVVGFGVGIDGDVESAHGRYKQVTDYTRFRTGTI